MIKVYMLPVDRIGNTDVVRGIEFISQAISEATEKPDVRSVIIEENADLDALALKVEEPTQGDLDNFTSLPEPTPLPRNLEVELDALSSRVKMLENKTKAF